MRRSLAITVVALLVGTAATAFTASAAPGTTFPEVVALPDGWLPEGIAVGKGSTFYSGSRANGAIYRGDLRTGEGSIFAPGEAGRVAVGLAVDQRGKYLFVAGGPTGRGLVYHAGSGALVASYALTPPGTFVNDVIVTRDAAYFTDSARAVLYRLSLGPDGSVDPSATTEEVALRGDSMVADFIVNGIEATPNGEWLIVVNSTVGALYAVRSADGRCDADRSGRRVGHRWRRPPSAGLDAVRGAQPAEHDRGHRSLAGSAPGHSDAADHEPAVRRADDDRHVRELALRNQCAFHHTAHTDHPLPNREGAAPIGSSLDQSV